jgi:hypothetical protein
MCEQFRRKSENAGKSTVELRNQKENIEAIKEPRNTLNCVYCLARI